MKRRRIHVLFEHGGELHSQCSGHLRLLRPFGYPTVRDQVEMTAGRRFEGGSYDAVIVERLWRPGVTLPAIEQLISDVRRSGARLIYAQDDNIFDLRSGMSGQTWLTPELIAIMELLASTADGVFVSTDRLKQRMARYNRNIVVAPNALDERLLVAGPPEPSHRRRLVIGYMGTRSHDDDLAMIAPALAKLHERHRGRFELQIVGGVARPATLEKLGDLPIRTLKPHPSESDYPLFMMWFTANIRWDIALAPLHVNPYNVCKSDIKLLDYSAIGAAGVYSRIAPYESISHQECGYLVENTVEDWVHALEHLIEDRELRERIARSGRTHLYGQRTLRRCAANWPKALDRLLA